MVYLSITPPDLSIYSVDPLPMTFFNILSGFLWQPLLKDKQMTAFVCSCPHVRSLHVHGKRSFRLGLLAFTFRNTRYYSTELFFFSYHPIHLHAWERIIY